LHLLERNGLLKRPAGPAYAAPYFLSEYLEANYQIFEEVRRKLPPSKSGSE